MCILSNVVSIGFSNVSFSVLVLKKSFDTQTFPVQMVLRGFDELKQIVGNERVSDHDVKATHIRISLIIF